MSEKSFENIELNAINPLSRNENDTDASNEKCLNVVPLIVTVDIEQNRIDDGFENIVNVDCNKMSPIEETEICSSVNSSKSSQTIHSVGCTKISLIEETESSTVYSSNSSICTNEYEPNNRGMISINKNFGQSSSFCVPKVPNNYVLNVGNMQNCTDIEVGGQKIYNAPVTINQFLSNYSDQNQGKCKWKTKQITSGLILTYSTVVFLLISVIIILINNITSFIPTPQVFRQVATTAEENESISSGGDTVVFEQSTTDKSKVEAADVVEVHWNCSQEKFFTTYATTMVMLLFANYLIYLFMKRCKKFFSSDCDYSDTIVSDTSIIPIVSRTDWQAKPPKDKLTSLVLPSTRVIIADTDTNPCSTQMCSLQIRQIQLKHMDERGWDDIGYNFLVGGDGAIYVGRGWNQQGAHSKGFNDKSICIAFIGRFNITEPPECQLVAAQKLIEEGIKLKKLTKDYRLYGHKQLRPIFDSPGLVLYGIIQKWKNWSDEILPP